MKIKDIEQWNNLDKQAVIKVNVFDTVLMRDFSEWSNLYYLMDDFFYERTGSNLVFHRIMEQLGKCGWKEKYKKLATCGFDNAVCCELKQFELELSDRYIHAREWFYSEYKDILALGGSIIFINNSQLPNDYVKHLLEKHNYYNPDVISETSQTCKENEIIDFSEDATTCIANRLDYPTKIAAGNLICYRTLLKTIGFSWLKKIAINRICDTPFVEWKAGSVANADPYVTGYYYLGMHLIGIAKWILGQVKGKSDSTLFFCARDCSLIMQVYEMLKTRFRDLPRAQYLQASRKLLLPSLYRKKSDFYQMPDRYNQFSPRTVFLLFWPFNRLADIDECTHEGFEVHEEMIKEETIKEGFNYTQNFTDYETFMKFIDWFWDNFYSKENHKAKLALLEEYYENIEKKDFIMDLGYSGRLQKEIARLCKHGFNVLYVAPDNELLELMVRSGQLNISTFYQQSFATSNVFREYLLSEPVPSCVGLKKENGKIVPVFESNPEQYNVSIGLKRLQQGALDFVNDFLEVTEDDILKIPYNVQDVSMPWEGYIRQIPMADLIMYDDFYQEEYHTGEFVYDSWYYRYRGEHINLPKINLEIEEKITKLILNSKQLVYFGGGKRCKKFIMEYQELLPIFVIDNDEAKDNQKILDIPVVSANKIKEWKDYYIVITVEKPDEIMNQIEKYGLKERVDFIWYKDLIGFGC